MGEKQNEKLEFWKEQFSKDKTAYQNTITRLAKYRDLYKGTKDIEPANENSKQPTKKAASVRNIVAETIDSMIDSNIPPPKVDAKREEDEMKANIIENFIRNELNRMPFEVMNDLDERVTAYNGADYFLVEWDNDGGTHNTIGNLVITRISPKNVIPQEGVDEIQKMDHFFIEVSKTKKEIKRKYNKDVETEEDCDTVTQVICYYRNEDGVIGRFSWSQDVELEDISDYYSRIFTKCKKCDMPGDGKECKYCGSRSFEKKSEEYETIIQDILDENKQIKIPAKHVKYDFVNGDQIEYEENTKVRYYKPNVFPIVLRKNISLDEELLGDSDAYRMKDQQNAIKKHETKVMEKLEKVGSFVTLPKGLKITRKNEEMLVVEVEDPSQIAMIQSVNLQGDVGQDMNYIEYNYEAARKIAGVTDSFQGRKDPTATSGKAKEFSAAQTAGRLESKKIMKNSCYAELFEIMFKFMLCFADEPRVVVSKDENGKRIYSKFNRQDFLEIDSAGELYWNDEFLFSVDSAAALASNREAMWQETRMNLQEGALGNPQDVKTLIRFWSIMETLHYPKASDIKQQLQKEYEEEQQLKRTLQSKFQSGGVIPNGLQ